MAVQPQIVLMQILYAPSPVPSDRRTTYCFVPTAEHGVVSRFNLLREESEGYAKLLDALLRFEKTPQNVLHMKVLVRHNLQRRPFMSRRI